MENDRLIRLQHFFAVDTRIKKDMYNMVPPEYGNDDSIIKYTNTLNDTLQYIFSELKCIGVDIFKDNSDFLNKINTLEQTTMKSFYSCGLDLDKLKKFYKECISNMAPFFINKVKDECVGYSPMLHTGFNMANTVNEILHYLHAYVLNNEGILQSIPLIASKENDYKYSISLRGANVPLFEQLFQYFPMNLDCGWTDMVIINDKKLIMMVRDRGHALTIEITLNENIARMEYFIPKLCNIEMINRLPGVNPVNSNSVGATGIVEIPISHLPYVLFDFISKVPMDSDMVFESRTI